MNFFDDNIKINNAIVIDYDTERNGSQIIVEQVKRNGKGLNPTDDNVGDKEHIIILTQSLSVYVKSLVQNKPEYKKYIIGMIGERIWDNIHNDSFIISTNEGNSKSDS